MVYKKQSRNQLFIPPRERKLASYYCLANGFEVVDTSARISLANLTDIEYAVDRNIYRQILDECYQDFKKTKTEK